MPQVWAMSNAVRQIIQGERERGDKEVVIDNTRRKSFLATAAFLFSFSAAPGTDDFALTKRVQNYNCKNLKACSEVSPKDWKKKKKKKKERFTPFLWSPPVMCIFRAFSGELSYYENVTVNAVIVYHHGAGSCLACTKERKMPIYMSTIVRFFQFFARPWVTVPWTTRCDFPV